MDEQTLVEVFRAKSSPEALILQTAMEDAGIHAFVENEFLQGVFPDVGVWTAAPRVVVQSQDAVRAREFLAQSKSRIANSRAASSLADELATCLACGARMTDQDEECPACGWSYKDAAAEDERADRPAYRLPRPSPYRVTWFLLALFGGIFFADMCHEAFKQSALNPMEGAAWTLFCVFVGAAPLTALLIVHFMRRRQA